VPEWYRAVFSLPWYRVYTLNVDDLELAIQRSFNLPRPLMALSATAPVEGTSSVGHLQIIHLNGTLSNVPNDVTFSTSQYGERLARQEPFYTQLVADLVSHPFVFVGTKLDEPPLWQHLQLRASRGGRIRELRPHSFLVTPSLDKARESVLAQYNISWIKAGIEEFAEETLTPLVGSTAQGFQVLEEFERKTKPKTQIPDVHTLAKYSAEKTDFLLGAEPAWSDIQAGRAITREVDKELWKIVCETLGRHGRGITVVSGTAGSGKSTSLMRVALTASNEGISTGWLDRESEFSPRDIRQLSDRPGFPDVLVIDDADIYGSELSPLIREIASRAKGILVVVGLRSTKVDAYIKGSLLRVLPVRERKTALVTALKVIGATEIAYNRK
jgi:hypothetical protein